VQTRGTKSDRNRSRQSTPPKEDIRRKAEVKRRAEEKKRPPGGAQKVEAVGVSPQMGVSSSPSLLTPPSTVQLGNEISSAAEGIRKGAIDAGHSWAHGLMGLGDGLRALFGGSGSSKVGVAAQGTNEAGGEQDREVNAAADKAADEAEYQRIGEYLMELREGTGSFAPGGTQGLIKKIVQQLDKTKKRKFRGGVPTEQQMEMLTRNGTLKEEKSDPFSVGHFAVASDAADTYLLDVINKSNSKLRSLVEAAFDGKGTQAEAFSAELRRLDASQSKYGPLLGVDDPFESYQSPLDELPSMKRFLEETFLKASSTPTELKSAEPAAADERLQQLSIQLLTNILKYGGQERAAALSTASDILAYAPALNNVESLETDREMYGTPPSEKIYHSFNLMALRAAVSAHVHTRSGSEGLEQESPVQDIRYVPKRERLYDWPWPPNDEDDVMTLLGSNVIDNTTRAIYNDARDWLGDERARLWEAMGGDEEAVEEELALKWAQFLSWERRRIKDHYRPGPFPPVEDTLDIYARLEANTLPPHLRKVYQKFVDDVEALRQKSDSTIELDDAIERMTKEFIVEETHRFYEEKDRHDGPTFHEMRRGFRSQRDR
jgi:hypothetical protein